jgi:hypothetical protein
MSFNIAGVPADDVLALGGNSDGDLPMMVV